MDPIALTRQLVELPSPTGAEGPVCSFMADLLERAGYAVERQPLDEGRFNVYAYRQPPVVVFSTHLDCVPPYVPFREDDEFLHGRGTCDAKGLAAAMVAAAERLHAAGESRVGLLFVVGEENGSDGARVANALAPKGRFLINGEPTENRLAIGSKGSLRADLTATGRAAHSAYPELGRSAILPLLDTLERIRGMDLPRDPVLGETTVNIGLIRGGVAPNVIPPSAEAQLLFRTVAPTGPLKDAIAACLAPGVTLDFGIEMPPVRASAPGGWETTVVSYASDLPFLASWGEGYQMGPGTILMAHTDEERIAKADLLEGVERYVRLARDLVAREAA
ncbi:MAG: M20/M25/M40 family metallo-hydrolase [Gemmatimonadota bacterium]